MAIFIGDTRTKIILDVGLDISAATVKEIKYINPDGTSGSWDAAQETTTSISFITIAGSLNVAGKWKLQAYIETASWKRHGEIATMTISKILGT